MLHHLEQAGTIIMIGDGDRKRSAPFLVYRTALLFLEQIKVLHRVRNTRVHAARIFRADIAQEKYCPKHDS